MKFTVLELCVHFEQNDNKIDILKWQAHTSERVKQYTVLTQHTTYIFTHQNIYLFIHLYILCYVKFRTLRTELLDNSSKVPN